VSGSPTFVLVGIGLFAVAGCAQLGAKPGIERADDLGLVLEPADLAKLPPLLPLPAPSAPEAQSKLYRDGFVEQWMARSDYLCREYKDKIILVSRNTRFATDATSTILSGLATIFSAVGTIHPLTGAATIVSGVGAAAQTDTFEQQSGEIIASAIQTARENQANQIEGNLTLGLDKYNIYRAQRDVMDYHNMCSLETALAQVRSSLKADKPNSGDTPPAAQGDVPLAPGQKPVTSQPGVQSPPPPPPPPPPPRPAKSTTVGTPVVLHPQCETSPGELGKHGLTACSDFDAIKTLLNVPGAQTPSDPAFERAVMLKKIATGEKPPVDAMVTPKLRHDLGPNPAATPPNAPAAPPTNAPAPTPHQN
jgi:hypothetical protein